MPLTEVLVQLRVVTSPSPPEVRMLWPGAARSGLRRPSLAHPRLEKNAMRSCADHDWVAATLRLFFATEGLPTVSLSTLFPPAQTTRNSGCCHVT